MEIENRVWETLWYEYPGEEDVRQYTKNAKVDSSILTNTVDLFGPLGRHVAAFFSLPVE